MESSLKFIYDRSNDQVWPPAGLIEHVFEPFPAVNMNEYMFIVFQ